MNRAFPRPAKTNRKPTIVLALLLTAAVLLTGPPSTRAGDDHSAFESFTLSAQFIAASASESFGDLWDPSNGGLFVLGSPFYLGSVELGVHVFHNKNLSDDVPPFTSVNYFLGWGIEWALPFDLGWFTGVRTGGFYMDFDDDDVADEVKTESELAFGLNTAIRYPLGENWSAGVTAEYLRVFTWRRIEYAFFGFGVSRSFAMPRSVRGFLE